ncbi:TRAP transporter small permease [Ruania zhangjianzhongii]|uniref:TRAP transporter small permease n=1 Tax=Ruania zhangjianzhongii TaxID=2603206 RepID=UPI0011CAE9DA|nr:TRAP transporter small permease [Ruania zhangjianzhongii]
MRALDAFHHGLNVFLRWFCVILFAAMVALVLAQVVTRFFDISAPWTEVSARYAFIWQGIIGAAYVIGEKDDVAIDWLVRKMPVTAVRGVSILAHLIVAFFAVWIMIYGGYANVSAGWTSIVQLLPVTQGQIFLVVPIAGALIAIYSALHIIDLLRTPAEAITEGGDDTDLDKLMDEGL